MNERQPAADAVRELFTGTSQEYASLFLARKTGKNFIFRRRLTLATAAARAASGQLFECATGSGEITAAILATGKFEGATILDLSSKMLELSGNRIKNNPAIKTKVELICEDIFLFSKENTQRKYDLIICLGLIAHTGKLELLLSQLRELLTKDGVILLQSTLLDHPGARLERFLSEEQYFKKHGYRINYFRHRDIEAAVAGARLKITACKRYALGLPFGDRLWGWGNYQLERIFQWWADNHGSEAIYVLKNDGAA
jgi:SAM-dependent methyltransferase